MSQDSLQDLRSKSGFAWCSLVLATMGLAGLVWWALNNQQRLISHSELAQQDVPANVQSDQPTSVASSQAAKPDISEIEAPDLATPELQAPEVATPEVATPEVTTPEVATPEVTTPDVAAPEVTTPEVTTPEVTTPEVTTPEVTTPESESQNVERTTQSEPESVAIDLRGQLADPEPVAKLVRKKTPSTAANETPFEKLRREELAIVSKLSSQLQIVPGIGVVDDPAVGILDQIFDYLFLYSETEVAVTVRSNDTGSSLRNVNMAQQRGEYVVDYLISRGLNQNRFIIEAESTDSLALGSHRIGIQAKLVE
jgi:outer membrane protein OmpA-like peptidoglycan-associated protein